MLLRHPKTFLLVVSVALMLIIAGFPLYETANASPIAFWSFDDSTPDDQTGNNNNGVLRGNTVFDSDDVPTILDGGKSVSFDNNNIENYIALDMSFSGVDAITTLTVSAWFKTSATGSTHSNWAILDFDRSEYFNLFVRGDGKVGFSTHSGAINDQVGNTDELNNNEWHHVTAVYDGVDKRIYVDGVLDATVVNPHAGNPLGSTNTRYGFIGDGSEASSFDANRNNKYYDGWLDDIALWDTALTESQITQIFQGASPRRVQSAPEPTTILLLGTGLVGLLGFRRKFRK